MLRCVFRLCAPRHDLDPAHPASERASRARNALGETNGEGHIGNDGGIALLRCRTFLSQAARPVGRSGCDGAEKRAFRAPSFIAATTSSEIAAQRLRSLDAEQRVDDHGVAVAKVTSLLHGFTSMRGAAWRSFANCATGSSPSWSSGAVITTSTCDDPTQRETSRNDQSVAAIVALADEYEEVFPARVDRLNTRGHRASPAFPSAPQPRGYRSRNAFFSRATISLVERTSMTLR